MATGSAAPARKGGMQPSGRAGPRSRCIADIGFAATKKEWKQKGVRHVYLFLVCVLRFLYFERIKIKLVKIIRIYIHIVANQISTICYILYYKTTHLTLLTMSTFGVASSTPKFTL